MATAAAAFAAAAGLAGGAGLDDVERRAAELAKG